MNELKLLEMWRKGLLRFIRDADRTDETQAAILKALREAALEVCRECELKQKPAH